MTHQEVIWKGKYVWVTGIMSKSGKAHRYVARFVGRGGIVEGQSKNGMLLVRFTRRNSEMVRSIPAGCLTLYTEIKWSSRSRAGRATNNT